ncbi:MAG: PhoD-like phosphatase N-terminal domain-containing protein, partial [Pirellula sp.]
MERKNNQRISRRDFSRSFATTGVVTSLVAHLQNAHANWIDSPNQPFGVMSGEVTHDSAVLWSRSDLSARMIVHWDTDPSLKDPKRILGPTTSPLSDWTARCILTGLPSGKTIFYQVHFENSGGPSPPILGHFATPDDGNSDVFFAWSGDTAGQGFGINL